MEPSATEMETEKERKTVCLCCQAPETVNDQQLGLYTLDGKSSLARNPGIEHTVYTLSFEMLLDM